MESACVRHVARCVATLCVAITIVIVRPALAQYNGANSSPARLLPVLGTEPIPDPSLGNMAPQQPTNPQRGAPLARLIENPDQTDGAPPFALTDQNGTIQRYVEPVAGVDLASHVGQVVVVRHDTGGTLLASQLEMPQQPLYPMVSNSADDRYATNAMWCISARPALRRSTELSGVEQVQYIDNDDTSVQMLPDDMSMSAGGPMPQNNFMPLDGNGMGGGYPVYADQMGPPGMMGPPPYGPAYQPMPAMPYPQGGMMPYPGPMMGPGQNCANNAGNGAPCTDLPPGRAQISGDVDLMLLRPNIAESAAGKLSESYQFSPRIILGIRGVGNIDGRIRYWHYDRSSDLLGTDDDIRIKFDVLDIEALHRFAGRRSEVSLSAGLRLAGMHLTDVDDDRASADMIGITMAADGVTPIVYFPGGHFGWVYGGRVSILGGNWGAGDGNAFIDERTRNDNVLATELYGGVELTRRFQAVNIRARLMFEMQNWKSDVLAESADIQSIGFFGPGLQLGAEF